MMTVKPKSRFARKMTAAEKEKLLNSETPGQKLFGRKFRVELPAAYLYTEADFARGVAVTGDKVRDAQSANELVVQYLPIAPNDSNPGASILEYFEQDIPNFSVSSAQDLVMIYEIIVAHLKETTERLNFGGGTIPQTVRDRIMKDLIRLDAFAATIHAPAVSAIPKHLAPDSIESRISRLLDPRMKVPVAPVPHGQENPLPDVAPYRSFTENLNNNLLNRAKRWQS